jgi:phosphatidate phosphatase APP1
VASGGQDRRDSFHEIGYRLERLRDRTAGVFRRAPRRLTVIPYLAHGTPARIVTSGRVLANAPAFDPGRREPMWRRAQRTIASFATREVAGVDVTVRVGDSVARGASDEEGYYEIDLVDLALAPDQVFHEVSISVGAPNGLPVHIGVAHAMVPSTSAERLIISDIDDTVLKTGARRTIQAAFTTLTGSAWTRSRFPGVSELYAGLARCASASENPFFYVSSSPWNLYGFLTTFIRRSALPTGPLFLRDMGIDKTKFVASSHGSHKREAIDQLLQTYELPVVLVGDTGQHDPEIYRALIDAYPRRVDAVLLRHVADEERENAVRTLYADIGASRLVLSSHSSGLALGAEQAGLVPAGWSERVRAAETTG